MNKSFNISFSGWYGPTRTSKLVTKPKWRIISLSLMGISLVFVVAASFSVNWREDHEGRYNVDITHGIWRVCRDIRFGATVNHNCSSQYANEAPDWFQCMRAFMLIANLSCLVGFAHGIYLIANIPPVKENSKHPNTAVSFAVPGLFYLLSAVTVLLGVGTYSVATAMDQALYFPENLPPTWGNSWAEVLAIRNTIPSDLPSVGEMEMTYGYSFGLAWFSFFTTLVAMIVNFVASVP